MSNSAYNLQSEHNQLGRQMMADAKLADSYTQEIPGEGRRETMSEAVDRVMNMHRFKYASIMNEELDALINKASDAYKKQLILGAQRALQFGGEPLLRKEARMYNCSASYCDRPAFFQEAMYLLLCGCGVGFSVQKHHVAKLPTIRRRSAKRVKVFHVPDSIEGWSDAYGVLISSYLTENAPFPEYMGVQVHFDLSRIREKGAPITGGFRAPGPEPLRRSLERCEALLEKTLDEGFDVIRPIVAYDFVMHMSDAVLSGGVRRSATICMFSKDDEEMLNAKTGNWFRDNPQRGRSNNSVMLKRDELTREEWARIMSSVRDFGEPGFIFVDNLEFAFNPCCVSGNTWIMTDTGPRKASELVGVDFNAVVDGKVYPAAKGGFWQTGVKPVYKVTTDKGNSVELTLDHRLKKYVSQDGGPAEWVEVANLAKGDRILLSNHKNYSWGISNQDVASRGYLDGIGATQGQGVSYDSVERASSGYYEGFIRGFIDGGSSGVTYNNPTDICASHPDKTLLEVIQRMLGRLGIVSVIHAGNVLSIQGIHALEYARHIGSLNTEVQEVLSGILNKYNGLGVTDNPGYFISRVESITLIGEEPVYDVTIPEVHEFCANGIQAHNCEIGMLPVTEDGISGWQMCNLVEQNGGMCTSPEIFYEACEAAAILATLQAGYTRFEYLGDATKRIVEKEALIGVSITGWMNNPDVLFDEAVLKHGAEIVKNVNRKVAAILGINAAARTTCAKPSGNASVLLKTASGIHGEHAPTYFRNVQMNIDSPVAQLIKKHNPKMVEKSVWSTNNTDYVISFPVIAPPSSIYKRDLLGVKQLEYVKLAQQHWVEHGTNVDLCTDPNIRHNISNTITVDDWDEVEQYIFDNRQWFAGISLLAESGDKGYAQAPFTEVHSAVEILAMYGQASLFASGLIVEGLHAFNDNLWLACDTAMGYGVELSNDDASDLLRRDWVRRFQKFATNFFEGNLQTTSFCLKDCFNLHKWVSIQRTIQPVDFSSELSSREAIDVDTLGSQGCAGGVCEISF